MKTISIYNVQSEQTMTSLEIAELTGKNHFDLLRAIRKMEPAWEKTCGCKFALTSRSIIQPNGGTREVPCYQLTKTECLYIATKFNDEARAKLVLRWEELELGNLPRPSKGGEWLAHPESEGTPLLWRGRERYILRMSDAIIGRTLRMLNEAAEDTLTATQVANCTPEPTPCAIKRAKFFVVSKIITIFAIEIDVKP
jgi:hypothetical protein